jgi:SOS response regulatory protein OraA/RecX
MTVGPDEASDRGGHDHESRRSDDKLARAAAALARAEGVAVTRAGAVRPGRSGRGAELGRLGGLGEIARPAVDGVAGSRPGWAPPPDDPETLPADADPESVARAIALRQLSMAPRSRAQLERKLRDRGCDDEVAGRVLDRLAAVGLIDDEAYAEMLVRSRQAGKGLARRALAHELRKQGIDQVIADEALGQVGPGDERVRAEELVAKKLRTMHGLAPEVQARRLAGMLARKGYSGELAWPVIRDAIEGAAEHQRD